MFTTTNIIPLLLGLFLVEASQLLAVWQQAFSDPAFPFTITQLDPTTARNTGSVIYSNSTLQSLFGGKTVFDAEEKVWYLQNFPQNDFPTIIGLDLSNPTVIKLTQEVKLSFEAFVIELDSESRRLILAGAIPHLDVDNRRGVGQVASVEVGYIDLTTLTYKTLTHLPDNHWFLTIAGSSSTLDSKSRLLVISMQNALVDPVQFWIHTVNIDTGTITSFSQNDYLVQSMVFLDNTIGTIMTTLPNSENSSLEFGLLDTKTGLVTSKVHWRVPALAFVVNGISVKDEDNGVIYSIVGNGVSPPAALAIIDIKSGMLKGYHYFLSAGNYSQPQYIGIIH